MLKVIKVPSMRDFDEIVERAREDARRGELCESDIAEAIRAVRSASGPSLIETSVRGATGEVRDREWLATRIGVPMSAIETFCDRWQVEELALFGSVLREDFGPDSDIDFLVRFKAGRTPGLFTAARIRRELTEMCNRPVDLVHRPTIERSRNYIRRKKILESARVVYAA